MQQQAVQTKQQEVVRVAQELFRQDPDWVTFFREVLGVEGIIRKVFKTSIEFAEFERSSEYQEIQGMVSQLRARGGAQVDDKEPTKVITVRLPQSLHETLRAEALSRNTSINKLCITKLLQVVDGE